MKIELKILEHGKEIYLPEYATSGSAAVDLRSVEDVTIYPGECVMIKTGLAIWIGNEENKTYGLLSPGANRNQNFDLIDYIKLAAIILPKSGRGHKEGLVLGNTVGLIDEDYQGELLISAWNRNLHFENPESKYDGVHFNEYNTIYVKAGERIAQMMFIPVIKAQWQVVDEFSNVTERSDGGFGSTGVK